MKIKKIEFAKNDVGLVSLEVDEDTDTIIKAPAFLPFLEGSPYWFSENGNRIRAFGRHDGRVYEINADIIKGIEVSHETIH